MTTFPSWALQDSHWNKNMVSPVPSFVVAIISWTSSMGNRHHVPAVSNATGKYVIQTVLCVWTSCLPKLCWQQTVMLRLTVYSFISKIWKTGKNERHTSCQHTNATRKFTTTDMQLHEHCKLRKFTRQTWQLGLQHFCMFKEIKWLTECNSNLHF